MRESSPSLVTANLGLSLESSGRTHVGLERRNNEDAFFVDDGAGFFVVCDGMGGHASGEIASRIAVDTMVRFVTQTVREPGFRFPFSSPDAVSQQTRVLDSAVRLANRSVFAEAQKDANHKGMGTTLVAVLAEGDGVGIVHVGDSRIYRYRDGMLEQVTEDHSLLNHYRRTRPMTDEEIRNFRGKNVIVRAVGLRDTVQPELADIDLLPDDILVLCTDGLSDLVDDDEVAALLATHEDDLETAASALIDAALAAGGKDNVTVVLARLRGDRAVRGASSRASDDTSPGFRAVGDDGAWDAETMPGIEVPTLGEGEPHVLVASALIDAVTPRDLPVLTDEAIAAALAERSAPPPLPGGHAAPPMGGSVDGLSLDLDAQTPPAMPAVPLTWSDDAGAALPPGAGARPSGDEAALGASWDDVRADARADAAGDDDGDQDVEGAQAIPRLAPESLWTLATDPNPGDAVASTPPPARPALDPAVEAVMRRAATRRAVVPRGGRAAPEVETPFARVEGAATGIPGAPAGDLAAGGRHDPRATVGAGRERATGRPQVDTLRYLRSPVNAELARPPAIELASDGDPGTIDEASVAGGDADAAAANVWDLPTLRMEAISEESLARSRPSPSPGGAAGGAPGSAAGRDEDPDAEGVDVDDKPPAR